MITLGVLADTHVPDRARSLAPEVCSRFEEAGVDAILHAGDVSTPVVLDQLERIAPVFAVRGNRDIFRLSYLPMERIESWDGVRVGLTHGHGRWFNYMLDRVHFELHGYYHERLIPRLLKSFPDIDVIVFGHGHLPLNERRDGCLLFNPGSPHFPVKGSNPSIGLLKIRSGYQIWGEILYLH